MSRPAGPVRYEPHRLLRRVLGPLFGLACLVATLTGLVVLAVLLGSVVVSALQRPPSGTSSAATRGAGELVAFLRSLVANLQSSDPARAGFRAGIVSSLWLLALVAV